MNQMNLYFVMLKDITKMRKKGKKFVANILNRLKTHVFIEVTHFTMRKIGPSVTGFVEKMVMTSISLMGASGIEKEPYKKPYFRRKSLSFRWGKRIT